MLRAHLVIDDRRGKDKGDEDTADDLENTQSFGREDRRLAGRSE